MSLNIYGKHPRCFFKKDDPKVEAWIAEQGVKILEGGACEVASFMQQSATDRKLKLKKRKAVDKCADYLTNNKQRLRYDVALDEGLPIASGVIEGACRHLINDRIDITGARWSLKGAEAILKLRALNSIPKRNQDAGFSLSKLSLILLTRDTAISGKVSSKN